MMHAHGADLLDICAGGHLDNETSSWLGERAEVLRSTISTQAAQFFDHAQSLYTMISSSDAIQALRNMTVRADNAWISNQIVYLDNTEQLQSASPLMQRYVMAEPQLRKMYLNNEVNGYGETYTNFHGNGIGQQHYDWRRVNCGIATITDEEVKFVNYVEDTKDDKELTVFEKVDILRVWNNVRTALDEHELDPTSAEGNLLG
jgi:hypothetical protein